MFNKLRQLMLAVITGACLLPIAAADVNAGLQALAGQDYATALREFDNAARQGNADAQYSLAHMYESGQGVAQNYGKAVKWYRKAAEQNYMLAQNNLAFMYENGQGVARNYPEAVKWFRKAAERGYALAQYNLGRIYAQGKGLPQDYVQAYLWTALAAAQRDAGAQENMNLLAARMTPTQITRAKKLVTTWLRQHGAGDSRVNPESEPDDSIAPSEGADKTFRL